MVMPRPYRWRNGKYLAVTLACLVKSTDKGCLLMPDHTLLHDILPELDADEVLDFMMPKPHPEFLVSGNAYTAHQADKTKCMVSVSVGDKRKEGVVFGDRFWIDNRISEPLPFTSMPLGWANSFGGPSCPDNPLGTGLDEVEIGDTRAIRLPNLESPLERIHQRGQRPQPFNFGQIRIDWPHRISKMGSCDETWIREVGTGFFDDMDPSAFNAAAVDQIWLDKAELSMDERFEIWNMHPDQHCWSGTLPSLRARCFIKRKHAERLDEVQMRATTVWFVPHKDCYILLFHGNTAIQEDDAFDVSVIMAGMERIGEPRSIDHYESVFAQRMSFETAALHALKDEELMPADMLAPWIENIPLDQHTIMSKMHRLRHDGEGSMSGGFVGPIKPMTLADLPALVEKSEQMHAETTDELKESRASALDSLKAEAASNPSGVAGKLLDSIDVDLDGGQRSEPPKLPTVGPPKFDDLLQSVASSEDRRMIRQAAKGAGKPASSLREMHDFSKQALRKSYLYSVHYQQGVARVGEHRAIEIRNRVLQKYRLNKRLSQMDLTGADLSGLDLSGADFSGAWMERVDLSNANLAGALFDETVLARGVFAHANLEGAQLKRCNISEASFEQASLKQAELSELICETTTTFVDCDFSGSLLNDFDSQHMRFLRTGFHGARMRDVSFESARFEQCALHNVVLDKVDFEDSVCQDVEILDSSIISSTVTNTSFLRTRIEKSVMQKATFTEDVKFEESAIENTQLVQCMFREVKFTKMSLAGSQFEQCDFSLADLRGCDLRRIATPSSMFVRTNFNEADLTGSNLIQGNFQKSTFLGSKLSGCNFFRADMSETILDPATKTDRTYVRRTRLAPFSDKSVALGETGDA